MPVSLIFRVHALRTCRSGKMKPQEFFLNFEYQEIKSSSIDNPCTEIPMFRHAVVSLRETRFLFIFSFVLALVALGCSVADNTFDNPYSSAGDNPGGGGSSGGGSSTPSVYGSWKLYSVNYRGPLGDKELSSYSGTDVTGSFIFTGTYTLNGKCVKASLDLKESGTYKVNGNALNLTSDKGALTVVTFKISGSTLEMEYGTNKQYTLFLSKM
jgi:hypothetical protein